MPIYSDAARAFADKNYPPLSLTGSAAAHGYDAGLADAFATPSTPAATEGHSAAANAYAATRWVVDSNGYHEAAEAYDAALATVTPAPRPRTITTAAELDALPGGSAVRGGDGWVYQCNHASTAWYLGLRSEPMTSEQVAQDAPLTLLVPATAVPEPVRLTDPEDPRIKPGARVRNVADFTVAPGFGSEYDEYGLNGVRDCIREHDDNESWFLLAEAPEDPDADVLGRIKAAFLTNRALDEVVAEVLRIARADQ